MITHNIRFYANGFSYGWRLQLPYRLVKGDFIQCEILWEEAQLSNLYDSPMSEEWEAFCDKHEIFEVENILINVNLDVIAWLKVPESKPIHKFNQPLGEFIPKG